MKVFISWSGPLSRSLAEVLRNWIPVVLQAVKPFYSPDLDRGIRWSSELAKELQDTHIGLICLTQDNLNSRWIMFEAGALSKVVDKTRLCPILFRMNPSDVERPLSDFNMAIFEKGEIKKVIETINRSLIETGSVGALDHRTLDTVFDKWWPDLESGVMSILESHNQDNESKIREDRELIEESLQLSRSTAQLVTSIASQMVGKEAKPSGYANTPEAATFALVSLQLPIIIESLRFHLIIARNQIAQMIQTKKISPEMADSFNQIKSLVERTMAFPLSSLRADLLMELRDLKLDYDAVIREYESALRIVQS